MNPLQVIFWVLGAVVILFIGWSFVRMPLEELKERRVRRQRPETSHSASGGTQSASDTSSGDWSA